MSDLRVSAVCTSCGRQKLLKDFYEHPKKRNGRNSYCKVCQKIASREADTRRRWITTDRRDSVAFREDMASKSYWAYSREREREAEQTLREWEEWN